MTSHERPTGGTIRALRTILAASILSTGLHYTHNFVKIDQYPQSDLLPNATIQVGILLVWPVLTAVGLIGYRLYARGRERAAHLCLAAYSVVGFASLGHFVDGKPDIPAFWFGTIFTDALTALAVVGFVLWSQRAPVALEVRARS